LRAFQRLRQSGVDAQLVIAGPMAEGESVLRQFAADLGIAAHFVFAGFVDEPDLRAIYSAATVCACPSFYEGFGFTALEAMACGTPVVCSSATSLPEVAGQGALYADPHSPEEIASQLLRIFSDADLRAALIERGWKNLQRFSWEDTAAQTLAVYHQALQMVQAKAAYA
jgi:glycosyltransferase involved in cell wall biosynthesis